MKKLLITLLVVLVLGGVFSLYIHPPLATPEDQFSSIPQVTENKTGDETGLVHESFHVNPEKIKIKGTDEYGGNFTKEFFIPKIKNVVDKTITDSINKELGFASVIGESKENLAKSANGTTGSDYQVTYDKDDVLSLDLFFDFMGPYPSTHNTNYNFNLKTGKHIELSEIFYKEKVKDLIQMLNAKLSANIKNALADAKLNNPDSKPGECSEDEINSQIQSNMYYHNTYGKFTESKLNYIIDTEGVFFQYDFDFPHVILACAPDQIEIMTFQELKDYIRPDGLLSNEIK